MNRALILVLAAFLMLGAATAQAQDARKATRNVAAAKATPTICAAMAST